MRLLALVLAAGLAVPLVADGQTPRTRLSILTGPEGSPRFAMAKDLQRLMEEVGGELGVSLDLVPSPGTPQAVVDGFINGSASLAIVPLDLGPFLRASRPDDRVARQVADEMQVVLPLYDEEVHVLARHGVARLEGLAGKRVSIGLPGSGTAITAQMLLRLFRVAPLRTVNLELPRALEALRRNEIDALIALTGAPSRELLVGMTAADRFTFLPVEIGRAVGTDDVVRVYTSWTLPAGTYPGQGAQIETVSIASGIASAGPVRCEAVGRLARAAVDQLPWLRENGHGVWTRVSFDPAAILAQPRLSPCTRRALRR